MAAAAAACSRSFYPSDSGVFISLEHGEDAVERFVSHLSGAFEREGIPVRVSDERETKGKSRMKKAIDQASVSIVVLSLDYLASKRRMDELLRITHQHETKGQVYFLVFFHVHPDDVEELKGKVGKAFNRLAESFPDKRRVKKWRDALAKAGGFVGEPIPPDRHESTLVTQILSDVLRDRSHLCLPYPKGLVEIGSRMQPVECLLLGRGAFSSDDDDDICGVGVWGMGGIGKFTIVNHVISRIQGQFDGCCLIRDMSEEVINRELSYLKDNGCKKVLIALVGADRSEPIECLLKLCGWIGCGSRIIVTTIDEDTIDIVVERDIKVGGTRKIHWGKHKVGGFAYREARRFLISVVFDGNDPPFDYEGVLDKAIAFAQGNPYALQALGRRLIGRSKGAWKSSLAKLDRVADLDIQSSTERSFNLLDREVKEIFPFIASFFEGDTVDYTIEMLKACFSVDVRNELPYLQKKSLIATDSGRIGIHSLHKAMSKEIIRKESPRDASRRRILWNLDDVHHVLSNSEVSGSIEGIYLDICKSRKLDLPTNAFAGMNNLKLLKIHASSSCSDICGGQCKVYASQGPPYLPSELRLLQWDKYPSASLCSEFNPWNLVDIQLVHSNLVWLWEGIKCAPHLKWFNLSHSLRLVELPDLSEAPELERIVLVGCVSLVRLHSFISHLKKLIVLNLKDCPRVHNLPSLVDLECLETLDLSGCQNLEELPQMPPNLKRLYVDRKWRSALVNSQIPEIFYC